MTSKHACNLPLRGCADTWVKCGGNRCVITAEAVSMDLGTHRANAISPIQQEDRYFSGPCSYLDTQWPSDDLSAAKEYQRSAALLEVAYHRAHNDP
ncbi:MAG: hypothetical protein ACI8PP_002568 [Candidatus Pseudothioglobus sp.]|jgi:hypothetical protein